MMRKVKKKKTGMTLRDRAYEFGLMSTVYFEMRKRPAETKPERKGEINQDASPSPIDSVDAERSNASPNDGANDRVCRRHRKAAERGNQDEHRRAEQGTHHCELLRGWQVHELGNVSGDKFRIGKRQQVREQSGRKSRRQRKCFNSSAGNTLDAEL